MTNLLHRFHAFMPAAPVMEVPRCMKQRSYVGFVLSRERQHFCFRWQLPFRDWLRAPLALSLAYLGIMEWHVTAFSLYGTAVPLHPLRKTGGSTIPPGHRWGYQPVLV